MAGNSQNGLKDLLPKNGQCVWILLEVKKSRIYLIVTCSVIIYYHWCAVVSTTARCDYSNFALQLHLAVQALNSPRPSKPSISQNVGWLAGLIITCKEKKRYCIWPWPDTVRISNYISARVLQFSVFLQTSMNSLVYWFSAVHNFVKILTIVHIKQ